MTSDRERKTNAFVFRNPCFVLPSISITTELIQTGYFCDFSLKTGILVNLGGGFLPACNPHGNPVSRTGTGSQLPTQPRGRGPDIISDDARSAARARGGLIHDL
jgi:hypothetical protein